MFEKVWKPYFDVWSKGMNDLLEKYFRSPSTLRGITNTLNTSFRGLQVKDKAMYTVLTSAGLPSYRDQKRVLHHVTRLGAQLEDVEEKLERFQRERVQQDADEGALALLFERLDELQAAQENTNKKVAQVAKAVVKLSGVVNSEEASKDEIAAQLGQLHEKLNVLLVQQPDVPATVVEKEATPEAADVVKAPATKATKKTTAKKTTKKKTTTKKTAAKKSTKK